MFTLGAASYIDAVRDKAGYRQLAEEINPVLEAEFGWLYERLAGSLEAELGAPVRMRDGAARPGFHIFLRHEAFRFSLGAVHRDLQFKHLDWSDFGTVDFEHPISFTLSIALPKSGAGLNRWLSSTADAPTYHPYTAGSMVVHSGFDVHQIAPASELVEGDRRITLQGHGVLADGAWCLYW
jgi:hypothetical protein